MRTPSQSRKKLIFEAMPLDYASLAALLIPRPIHDEVAYKNTLEMAEAFAGYEAEMNADQTDYFDLLCNLIADYEAVEEPRVTPLEILRHALNEHGMNASDLSRLLGAHRTLGPKILSGERAITAEHARTLWRHFGLPAGAFIE
jgi:antitoxin component HigA of HigAB toxin-antitoxin module